MYREPGYSHVTASILRGRLSSLPQLPRLMRLKEESKHRAIDLSATPQVSLPCSTFLRPHVRLEVMALSREAAALTGSGGKSYASKNRRHRKFCI